MLSNIKPWLKFIRATNLIIMVITFYLIRGFVWRSFANDLGGEAVIDDLSFLVLVIVTLLVAAAGNIVNDIYDIEIDQINKPDKIFINKIISKKGAWQVYFVLNGLALGLIVWLFFRIDWFLIWMYPFGYILAVSMLWLYSYKYKKSVLRGNVIVSIFVTFVPLSICYPELVNTFIGRISWQDFFVFVSIAYIFFAFISTMLREIIKDIEDKDGDAQFGGQTLPIVYGVARAKRIAYIFGGLLLILMVIAEYWLFLSKLYWSTVYGLASVLLPMLYLLFNLNKAHLKKDFHHLSQIAKIIMLAGLIFLIVLHFEYYF